MFPRLHVNDKEKGGPRAPPRNKMALYEQLSIPSQRFNPGSLHPDSLPTSSSKGISDARNLFFPLHLSPTDSNLGANFSSPVTQIVQEKRERDEDDCNVPVYVQSAEREPEKKGSETPEPRTALSRSDENHANPEECEDGYVKEVDSAKQKGKIDGTDAVAEISMLDSVSCSDVSHDDVVGVLGQRHFWKARETIANQQRVFASQLFELHRLIKVQQSIARFDEDRVSSKFIDKSPLSVVNSEAPKKSNHKMECSAENALSDNASLHSAKNGHCSSAADPAMPTWCLPHPPAHQWLIPVMSPSEGLVYKPCPAPGFIGLFPPPYGWSQSMGIPPMNSTISGSAAHQTRPSCTTGSTRRLSRSLAYTQQSGFVPRNGEKDRTRGSIHPSGVIRVVPRNPRSAVESAARIFQSIQEERRLQSDSLYSQY